jgi:hypothetical protein
VAAAASLQEERSAHRSVVVTVAREAIVDLDGSWNFAST